jgi:hypothetical protein
MGMAKMSRLCKWIDVTRQLSPSRAQTVRCQQVSKLYIGITKLRTTLYAVYPPIATDCSNADQRAKEDDGGKLHTTLYAYYEKVQTLQ